MIICDSREKKWDHIEKYFQKQNVQYCVRKLDFGDYAIEENPSVVVDRKRNLDEVAQNLCSADSSRFWREMRGANKNGIKMIVLIEHGAGYKSLFDVAKFHSKYARITGNRMVEEMLRVSYAYGVDWLFCDKRQTGKRIMELLKCDSGRD